MGTAGPLYQDQFSISIGLLLNGKDEALNLVTAYPMYSIGNSNEEDCSGHLNMTACTFQSAVGEYDVSIWQDGVTLLNAAQPEIVALANNSAVDRTVYDDGERRSTLAAIVELAWERFECYAAIFREGDDHRARFTAGMGPGVVREFELPTNSACPSYSDPREYVVKQLNTMMVYAGTLTYETD